MAHQFPISHQSQVTWGVWEKFLGFQFWFSNIHRFKNGGYCGQVAEATAVICAPSANKIMAELRKEREAILYKIGSYHRHIEECTSEMSEYILDTE